MKVKSRNKLTGDLGENLAVRYLKNNGFVVLQQKYKKKWGEIDIVARDTVSLVHFIEVKTVSYETTDVLTKAVSYETWRPEEMVHRTKLHQIHKAIETWLSENEYNGDWQIDVMAVRLVSREKYASVKLIENIIA